MDTNTDILTVRLCPVHSTELVYVGNYLLGCTGRIKNRTEYFDCPHQRYTDEINPEAKIS